MFIGTVEMMFNKLGTHKIMSLATSVNDYVTIRNISAIIIDNKVYFKTDINFEKTKQLLESSNVAMCYWGVSFEGNARNLGVLKDNDTVGFSKLYQEYWDKSYNAYEHEDSEILIEVSILRAEVWDQDENDFAFQTLIDFEKESVVVNKYD